MRKMMIPSTTFFLLLASAQFICYSAKPVLQNEGTELGSSKYTGTELGSAANLFEGNLEVVSARNDFTWLESPLWNDKENYLLFTDVKWRNHDNLTCGMIWKYDVITKQVTKFLECAGTVGPGENITNNLDYIEVGGNGMTWGWDGYGDLLLCQHGRQRIVRINVTDIHNGAIESNKVQVVVDQYNGVSLNSPNDLYLNHNTGDIIFTDPPFGHQLFSADNAFLNSFRIMPQTHANVFRIKGDDVTKNGLPVRSIEKVKSFSIPEAPNGITLTGSGKDLLVMVTNFENPRMIIYYSDGNSTEQTITFNKSIKSSPQEKSLPRLSDGVTYWKEKDIIFANGPGGVYIHLGTRPYKRMGFLRIDDLASNNGIGGGYLWVTVSNRLMRIKLKE